MSHVYFVHDTEKDLIKIRFSTNLGQRMAIVVVDRVYASSTLFAASTLAR